MDHPFDKSFIRRLVIEKKVPITRFMLESIDRFSRDKIIESVTLLGICPISRSTIRASIEYARFMGFPLIFTTTLNQVDLDGGYTGLTHKDFVNLVRQECEKLDFWGPVIIALDHGGPWLKDKHVTERLIFEDAMEWTKRSIESCIEAGYDLIHIDTTKDIWISEEHLGMDTIIERTVSLIEYAETIRREKGVLRLDYEVGTEEVHGGLTSPRLFEEFIIKLKIKLKDCRLDDVWPCFIVGNIGTSLTANNILKYNEAKILADIARRYGIYLKGHYTDFVVNPEEYPRARIGGANIGPELADAEYSAIEELNIIEEMLFEKKYISETSSLIEKLNDVIIRDTRWRKWLTREEKNLEFSQLPLERRKWLLRTCSRYFLSHPEIFKLREKLYRILKMYGISADERIRMKIWDVLEKYVKAFNLRNFNSLLEKRLIEEL
ncbi:MAG: class II D-tagatose-bisphosphate aldolase, non-catalytic subunit [Aigarchaeota archaeon]|nr:class II D-tagatose-bisphosphate aldolase, non-catalytic subunit [Aigarchaeota archaeon]